MHFPWRTDTVARMQILSVSELGKVVTLFCATWVASSEFFSQKCMHQHDACNSAKGRNLDKRSIIYIDDLQLLRTLVPSYFELSYSHHIPWMRIIVFCNLLISWKWFSKNENVKNRLRWNHWLCACQLICIVSVSYGIFGPQIECLAMRLQKPKDGFIERNL